MKNWIASYSSTGLIIAGAVIGVPLACWLDIYYGFVRFESANSGLHLGDAMVVAAFMNVTLMVILFLRGRRLKLAIQRRVDAETRANRLARNDSLTGLANRRTFQAELQRRIESSHADDDTVAILLVDLDRFKPVNDAHGHTAGDLLLQRVADRLTACTRNDEFVARLSADEFAVIVSVPKAEPTEPTILAQRIVTALSRRFAIADDDLQIGACVGIAVHTDGLTAEDLVKNADQAMYRAKQTGRNRVAHFSAALGKETCERALLESQIHRALRQGEFEPFFQPLIDLPSGETCGFEILARWRHPERGLVSPAVFIPVAEEIGLIGDITLHILHKACETALTWQEPYSLSFNLSPLQFQQPRLMDKITEILVETGFPGERLEMEITESAIILDIAAARTAIEQFKAFGFSVALDDFGTGHSSLTTLRQLPFDKVKIDRSFVTGSVEDEENRKIVLGIIGLAHSLGLEVTAEGIETEAESAWLREIGCEMAQGFLFSRPLPADQLQWYIDEEAERSAARPDAATRQAAHG